MKAQRLVWSEGMLMSPQHLQALDRFHEVLVEARVGAITPYDWGVVSLELDPAALGTGQVRVQRFAGVMPGGAALSFEEADADAPSPRAVADHFPAAAHALDVYLALAREREGVPAYAANGDAQGRARYLTASWQVQDVTAAAGTQVPITFGRPNVVLLFGDEPREDFETLKIAEVVRAGSGQLAYSGTYVPPCLRVSASPFLVAGLRQIATRLIAKQRELVESRGQREAPGNLAAAELSRFLQLFTLNGGVPVVTHLAESGDASARDAFLLLSQLAGQLCTFPPSTDPSTLPKFSYTDLRATFEPLFAKLSAMLGGMAMAQYVTVPLEQRPGGLHVARIQDERLLRSRLFLSVRSALPETQVAELVPRLCKIASTAEIQALVNAAAPGLPLRIEHRPPPEIPLRPGTLYFSLATDSRHWQGILANRNLVVFLPPPFEPARTTVELLALVPPVAEQAPADALRH